MSFFDINLVRGVITVLWFGLFVAISLSAWSARRREEFRRAALMPLENPGRSARTKESR